MKKQYNEELVMNLVKALEIALPEGMSVLVVGSAEPSEKELALIIHQLSGKLAGTGCCENDSPNNGWVYGSREDWVLCDDEEEADEETDLCDRHKECPYGDCDGYLCYDGSCPYEDEDEDEIEVEEEEEPHANMERIREMLEDIAELMADLFRGHH